MRLNDKESGKGNCDPTGSGDFICMFSGSSAYQCYQPGNAAVEHCDTTGNSVS